VPLTDSLSWKFSEVSHEPSKLVEDLPCLDFLLMPHHRSPQQGSSLCCPSSPSLPRHESHPFFHFYSFLQITLLSGKPALKFSQHDNKVKGGEGGQVNEGCIENGFQEKVVRR